jgi:ectoine hydroxylase-related dioxygenase (phytanoyl-CoA dioxygenase family)
MSEGDPVRLLSDAEVDHYHSYGWARMDRLVASETATSLLAAAQEIMDRGCADYGAWQYYRHAARDLKQEPFRSVAFSANMASNVQRLAERDMPIRLWGDTIFRKMPAGSEEGAEATKWHQDLPHYPHDRVGHVAIWLAIDEVVPEQGALRFLSKSKEEGPLGKVFGGDERDLLDRYPALAKKYEISSPLHLNPGDATCHHGLTVHSAPQNTAQAPRWSFVFTYIPSDVCYNGSPFKVTDGPVLEADKPFENDCYPIIGQ